MDDEPIAGFIDDICLSCGKYKPLVVMQGGFIKITCCREPRFEGNAKV